jgi:predicted  nucleic acid-binding Zn-ribbon protein
MQLFMEAKEKDLFGKSKSLSPQRRVTSSRSLPIGEDLSFKLEDIIDAFPALPQRASGHQSTEEPSLENVEVHSLAPVEKSTSANIPAKCQPNERPDACASASLRTEDTKGLNPRMQTLIDTNEHLRSDVQRLLAQIRTSHSRQRCLQSEIEDLSDRLSELQSFNTALEERVSSLSAAAASRVQGPVASAEEFISLQTSLDVERSRAAKAERELVALREALLEEQESRRSLQHRLEEERGNIRVILRMRPSLAILQKVCTDQDAGAIVGVGEDTQIVLDERLQTVTLVSPLSGTKSFEFYRVVGPQATQQHVFNEVLPLLQCAVDGFNVAILAYGQTGSGKTHTLLGDHVAAIDELSSEHIGVIPRAVEALFIALENMNKAKRFSVECSLIELYNDLFGDLLAPETLQGSRAPEWKQGSGSRHSVRSSHEVLALLRAGFASRQVHSTKQNEHSSRSHAIVTLHLFIVDTLTKQERKSKIVFADLAGSERVSKSHSTGERLREAQFINKSLSALGDVVAALSQKNTDACASAAPHIPYRNSKLTLALQDCIGGQSKTLLIACVSPNDPPAEVHTYETLSTLLFAGRVRRVQNRATRAQEVPAATQEAPLHRDMHGEIAARPQRSSPGLKRRMKF